MADTVTGPTILQQNDNRVVIKIVNQSDGTGSTTVFGDVSALAARSDGTAVAHLGLLRVWYSCQGGDGGDSYARLDEEDSDGDIPIIGLTGAGYWDFREFGGIQQISLVIVIKAMLTLLYRVPRILVICTQLLQSFKKSINND